jgi:hypothetical protein
MQSNKHFENISLTSSQTEKSFRQKLFRKSTHTALRSPFSPESYHLWETVEKLCGAGQVTNCNMVHVHCMLDTYGYRHTLRICNAFPLQQWLQEHISMFRYVYVRCLLDDTQTDSIVRSIGIEYIHVRLQPPSVDILYIFKAAHHPVMKTYRHKHSCHPARRFMNRGIKSPGLSQRRLHWYNVT